MVKYKSVRRIDKSKITILDLETTGIQHAFDEILQISMIDGYGCPLFSSYIKTPKKKKMADSTKG